VAGVKAGLLFDESVIDLSGKRLVGLSDVGVVEGQVAK
jgi:hypothetical protein